MPDPVREVAQDRSRLHNDTPTEMRGLALAFFCCLVLSCDPRKPPCDEAQLRAADKAFLDEVTKVCLLKYDAEEECPEYPGLKAKHKADLRKACPQ